LKCAGYRLVAAQSGGWIVDLDGAFDPQQQIEETNMRFIAAPVALAFAFWASAAMADLQIYKDYTPSDAIWSVTAIKVAPNMGDAYLEGIKKTWVSSNQVSKSLGQIEDYQILRSNLPESGAFNVLLIVKFKNDEMLAPNKARYDAFMAKFGEAQQKATTEQAQRDYPAMREIVGEYQFREITLH
jgi:hypothetical protein